MREQGARPYHGLTRTHEDREESCGGGVSQEMDVTQIGFTQKRGALDAAPLVGIEDNLFTTER
jgi:hypothetical protein